MANRSALTRDELIPQLRAMLALTTLEPLPEKDGVFGLPGIWSPRPDGVPGARVELAADEFVLVDGVRTTGVVDLVCAGPFMADAPTVTLDDDREVVVLLVPDAGVGARWVGTSSDNANSLLSFQEIAGYAHDDRWVVPAVFIPATPGEAISTVPVARGDDLHDMKRVGWMAVRIDDTEYRLSIDSIPGESYVIFRDATSATESYGAGRIIRLPEDPSTDVLDFNQSEVLPCALNSLIPCPLPPPSNIIRSAIRAGERDVIRNS